MPLAIAFSKIYEVNGFDINKKRIEELKKGIDDTNEVSSEKVKKANINFSDDPKVISESNFIVIAVPTPIDDYKKPDIRILLSASATVGKYLKKGSIIVYESTVHPGCTERDCVPILEKESSLKYLKDFKVGYSPERINPGDKVHTVENIVKVVSGCDKGTLDIVAEVYSSVIKAGVHKAPSIKVAEAAKIIENTQRDINIALMNELKMIFDKAGVNLKDVLKAAGTKWNFLKFAPGLVGGHCFDKNSFVYLINNKHLKIKKIGKYIDSLNCKKQIHNDVEIFYPENVKILSFDMIKNKTSFKPVTLASRRKSDTIFRIKCAYNYNLEVTNLHPVIVYDKGLNVRFAKDVKVGDMLVLNKILPSEKKEFDIDILENLDERYHYKIRVKLKNNHFSEFKDIINRRIEGKKGNYYVWNYLPLRKYLQIEKELKIDRKDVYLCTGRGPSFKKFPCIITINKNLMRLIGYYLSEGCITKDKSLRTRFTFNRKEKEYINDLKNILNQLNMDYSVYQDKSFQSTTLKVSSFLFSFLLRDVLKCGTNCYNMQIPEIFFDFKKEFKEEFLKALFRGDGGVVWYEGLRRYKKNGKKFTHSFNSVEVSYFTSSKVLFQQVILFLLNLDIVPKLAKRQGYLSIMGSKDIKKVEDWFLSKKKEKITNYLKNIKKKIVYTKAKKYKNYVAIKVEGIEKIKTDYVYSMEVEDNHTLITSNGIIAHNCIGVDPYYLAHEAERLGHHPQMILSGRRINDNMAKYEANRMIKYMINKGSSIKGSRILVLGGTFKPDVPDTRNSKVKDFVYELKSHGCEIDICEPHIKEDLFGLKNVDLDDRNKYDFVVKAVNHDVFKDIKADYEILQ